MAKYTDELLDEKFRNFTEISLGNRSAIIEKIDENHKDSNDRLERIEIQTVKTNGRVNKLERNLLILGTATLVIIALKFPELLAAIKILPL
jgi:Flp pilus assembly protein TadB